jgi:kynurenine formamidase
VHHTRQHGMGRAGRGRPGARLAPGHLILLVREGIYIIEALNLEALARDGVREFAFACLPLKLRGGTGSPVRPIALV